ncbi:WD40/YVTN/BNR-like repeat-containing protein [Magnetovibrio sp.]|uniref:WD40/YVTN/BNR-like repeat-containing protein n=1 Tax=Magnetovibrio sp. TaxID=2024836 RepID=UPI002F93DEBB
MKRMRLSNWLLVPFFGILPSVGFAAPAADVFPVLDTPAVVSERASSSAILSVTKAGERLVAVGERGIVLLSDDAGLTWRQVTVPVSVTLTAVNFVSSTSGWAVGHFGIVLHTDDGGETWTKQLDGQQAATLALQAAEQRAIADPEGAARALSEARYLVADGPDKPFLDVLFVSENTGFVIGAYNLIFRTDDGGKTWTSWQAHVDNPGGLHLYGIRAVGDDIYIVGEQGLLLKADRSGAQFKALQTPYEGSYFGLIADRSGDVIVFGLRANAYRSADGGVTWNKVDLSSQVSISDGVRLSNGSLALVSQSGEVFIGSDQGLDFKPQPMRQPLPATSVVQTDDGAIVIGSLRGVKRIDLGSRN